MGKEQISFRKNETEYHTKNKDDQNPDYGVHDKFPFLHMVVLWLYYYSYNSKISFNSKFKLIDKDGLNRINIILFIENQHCLFVFYCINCSK